MEWIIGIFVHLLIGTIFGLYGFIKDAQEAELDEQSEDEDIDCVVDEYLDMKLDDFISNIVLWPVIFLVVAIDWLENTVEVLTTDGMKKLLKRIINKNNKE